MTDKDQSKLDPQHTRKLDGGLRRLLAMSEAEIRKGVRDHKSRLARLRRKQAQMRARVDTDSSATAEFEELLMPHPVWEFVALTRFRLRPIQIRAITHFSGNQQDLEALGLTVRSQAHDIFTIEGTPDELRNLALQPATQVVRLPRVILPTLRDAAAQAEIDDVHQPRPANPTGYRGQGILVGLVDSPLDVRHATFREAAAPNNSRVLYYWVQAPDAAAAPGVTPQDFDNMAFNGLNFGRLYTTANINAALGNALGTYGNGANQISQMPVGSEHGTHTAGIAAGNGQTAGFAAGLDVGSAPEASIVHVSINYSEDRLVQAIDFIFRAANRHTMPAVVSVSLGTNQGPHDGTTLFDQNRDNLIFSFENRSVLFAAGNDNNDNGFTRGTVAPTGTVGITFTPTNSSATPGTRLLDVWYTGPELEVELRRGTATSGFVAVGTDFTGTVSGNTVNIDRDPEPSSNFRGIRFTINATHSGQVWTINLRNPHGSDTVNYWAWTGVQGQHASVSNPVHDELTIADTACGISVLTVGAAQKVLPANPASGEPITTFSGAGPTLDGRVKPEVIAVGESVMSANSAVLHGYVSKSGTSMATPLVAGLVALIMEERTNAMATIDQDTIKGLLIEYANRLNLDLDPTAPGFNATERNLFGYGRVRAVGPIDHHLPPQNVDVWVKTAPDDFGLEPFIGDRYWIAPEIRICPQGSGADTNQLTFGNVYDVTVTVRNLGDNAAVGTDVWLKYTRPFAAPNNWTSAEDTSNTALHTTVDVPALGFTEAHFVWRPDSGEVPPPYPDGHFCVLAEVSHLNDALTFPAPTGSGTSAWDSNIRGTNNVALRNVNIQ
jgi:hypothetical protein